MPMAAVANTPLGPVAVTAGCRVNAPSLARLGFAPGIAADVGLVRPWTRTKLLPTTCGTRVPCSWPLLALGFQQSVNRAQRQCGSCGAAPSPRLARYGPS